MPKTFIKVAFNIPGRTSQMTSLSFAKLTTTNSFLSSNCRSKFMIKLLPVLATLGKYRKSEGRTIMRWSFSDLRDSIYVGSFMLFTGLEKSIGKNNILQSEQYYNKSSRYTHFGSMADRVTWIFIILYVLQIRGPSLHKVNPCK